MGDVGVRLDAAADLETVHARHHHVEQHDIRRFLLDQLKRLRPDAVPAALEKAKRYRLLNEPMEAESICLDVLEVDPDNGEALSLLILALSDRLEDGRLKCYERAAGLLPRLPDEYSRVYLEGLLCERRAKAVYLSQRPRSQHAAYEWFRKAMAHYEKAEPLRPEGNDDAILRWNTCARILDRHREICAEPETQRFDGLLE